MTQSRAVRIGDLTVSNDRPLTLIAGPCALESRDHALEMSQALSELTARLGIGLIYKTSFDKANRTSLGGNRGIGLEEGLPILAEVRESVGCPVLTDVHEAGQCERVAEAVDVLQIPAFLCRQTDLLVAAARTAGRSMSRKASSWRPGT
jgi:2-dehydro-3-deoxyphosphooctonate aldolase (KDO 8-P synthase)